ncbi:NUDIX hydrolase [Streptomyces mobaraensis]|uniref:NUDIX hydrolase n=1 Tax=Streptomyces mobaraensis TaxID=35621 RepID=UPI003325B4EA
MSDEHRRGPARDAAVVVARDGQGPVAILTADFPRHGGEYLFLPGGRREHGESPEECARRELLEEAGITARQWRPLGTYAITLESTARVHLFEARGLTLGPQQLTPTAGLQALLVAHDRRHRRRPGRTLPPPGWPPRPSPLCPA